MPDFFSLAPIGSTGGVKVARVFFGQGAKAIFMRGEGSVFLDGWLERMKGDKVALQPESF